MISRRLVPLSEEQGCDAVKNNFEDILTTLAQPSIPAKTRITLYHSDEKISEEDHKRLINALRASNLSPGMLFTIKKSNQCLGVDGIGLVLNALQNRQQDFPKNFKFCLSFDLGYQYNIDTCNQLKKALSENELPPGLTLKFDHMSNLKGIIHVLEALKCHASLPENFTLDLSYCKFGRNKKYFNLLFELLKALKFSPGFRLNLENVEMTDSGAQQLVKLLEKKDFKHNFTLILTGNSFDDLTYQRFASAIFTSLVLNDCFKIILPFDKRHDKKRRLEKNYSKLYKCLRS